MKRKKKIIIIIVLIILFFPLMKLLSNEDDWMCVDGEWVKHGYPSAPKPTEPCEKIIGGDVDEHGCLGAAGYSWNETKQACVREWIKESDERYQDRVYCKPEDRNSNMCTFLYDPVCAYPMKKTEPNDCIACSKVEIIYYEIGECSE